MTRPPAAPTSELGYLDAVMRSRPGDEVADPAELVRAMLARPPWHRRAACRGTEVSVFFAVRGGGNYDHARELCAACPVVAPCLADALAVDPATDDGYRGGTTAAERRRLRIVAA